MSERGRRDELAQALLALRDHVALRDTAAADTLLDAHNALAWDDAIHVEAPWAAGETLCGQSNRNLVPLVGQLPGGMEGCWSCLRAAGWLRENLTIVAMSKRPCTDFTEGTCADHDGTGLWCDPCLARALLANLSVTP